MIGFGDFGRRHRLIVRLSLHLVPPSLEFFRFVFVFFSGAG